MKRNNKSWKKNNLKIGQNLCCKFHVPDTHPAPSLSSLGYCTVHGLGSREQVTLLLSLLSYRHCSSGDLSWRWDYISWGGLVSNHICLLFWESSNIDWQVLGNATVCREWQSKWLHAQCPDLPKGRSSSSTQPTSRSWGEGRGETIKGVLLWTSSTWLSSWRCFRGTLRSYRLRPQFEVS